MYVPVILKETLPGKRHQQKEEVVSHGQDGFNNFD